MKLKLGLIGTGGWGRTHALAYRTHPSAELVAVYDKDEARGRAFAKEFGIPKVCRSAEEVAADPEVRAVAVVTPDFAHKEGAFAVINEGKALLIEKPLATTVADAEEICAAARRKGIQAMVDFHNRFNPQYDNAKKRLENGLGKARFISMRHSNSVDVPVSMLSWANRTSALWFLGSHSSDLVRWLMGSEVVEVYGTCNSGILRSKGIDAPDAWAYILKFADGGIGTIENTWILPDNLPMHGDFRAEIIAEHGVYYTTLLAPEVSESYGPDGHHRDDYLTQLDIRGVQFGFTLQSIQYFVDCVIRDEAPFITLEDGLANTRILCAVQESAATGQPVKL